MKPSSPRPSRRTFLQAASATATVSALAPLAGFPATAIPDEKIEVGFMGLNARGFDLLKDFLDTRQIMVGWLCDVDARAVEKSAALVKERQARAFKTTPDFRKMLEDRRLQAVVMATPDHLHAPGAILALKAGKAVYLEKPASHNPREGELLVQAVKKHRGILQVGLQRRSMPWVIDAVRRVRRGDLGEIHVARVWYAADRKSIGFGHLAPIPEWLNYDLWQGPAPERPFRDNVVHYNWHWFWHWGTGELGNNGVHFLDIARWALDLGCPLRVFSAGGRFHFEDDQESPDNQVVTYDFGKIILTWENRSCLPSPNEGETSGLLIHGQKATLVMGPSGFRILDPAGKEIDRVRGESPTGPHVLNFLDAVRDRARPLAAPADEAQKSTLLCQLGNIAQRSGETLVMNPKTSQIRNAKESIKFWSREYRAGWAPVV